MTDTEQEYIQAGRITGLYGVRGWVKVYSYTEPRENIIGYSPWRVRLGNQWHELAVAEGRRHGKGVIARLAGYEDRSQAERLLGADIAIRRDQLPPLAEDEYYWSDLEGLRVVTREGRELGRVHHLIATGANDVLVVRGERERLIPFLQGDVVLDVDLAGGSLRVDWDPEF